MNKIEEIKELKSLLDAGAISPEEFETLKKRLILSQSSNNSPIVSSQNQRKTVGISGKRMWLVIACILIFGIGLLGITNYSKIKSAIDNILNINHLMDGNIVYENGKRIGKLVKMRITSELPHTGSGAIPISVPDGKMWTPLYYELVSGSPERYGFNIWIYPEKVGISRYSSQSAYRFEISKEDFISYKYSKQNFKSIAGNGKQVIGIFSWASPLVFNIYFLEESLY